LGAALLVAAVVGSGIMAERLASGNAAIALLANTLATAAALYVLIATLEPISGAHFNPLVTLVAALRAELRWQTGAAYVIAQLIAAVAGTLLAHAMFELPLLQIGSRVRAGHGQWLAESVASFALLIVILGCQAQRRHPAGPVAAIIASAYWFTASTSFANPAVTVARALTDSFAGIRPRDVPLFLAAQSLGAVLATLTGARLFSNRVLR
ncbi:MAG: aquaporin, partial [Steroidobacteraceae bacterium]|nr:aquaporin [Steroidobacteraceae bacterium]MDW8258886.1 aquaporin [Gammaproteobacteria bacterium]